MSSNIYPKAKKSSLIVMPKSLIFNWDNEIKKFNPNLTDRTAVELKAVVTDTIADYNLNDLNKFDGVFRHSALLKAIDATDPSILNSTVRPFIFQNITPSNSTSNNFSLAFAGSLYIPAGTDESVISSTAFEIGGVTMYFADSPITGSETRQIYATEL